MKVIHYISYEWHDADTDMPKSTAPERRAILNSLDPAEIPAEEVESYNFSHHKSITDRVITVIKRAIPHLAANQVSQKELAQKLKIREQAISRIILKLLKAGYENEKFRIYDYPSR